ncbi:MAG: NAD(P)H-hydrate dehydratase [Elusimicrobiota bacterium]
MKTQKIDKTLINRLIQKRRPGSHKGDYGNILILAGSKGMTGAAVLSANACVRSGAGLVTLGIPENQQPAAAKRTLPEIMTLPLKETKDGTLSLNALNSILNFIGKHKITTLAVGPGLTTNFSTQKLVIEILKRAALPVVIDADGLNALNGKTEPLKESAAEIIITPHPGELTRLTRLSMNIIQSKRAENTLKFAKENKVICVLKGNKTVVSDGKKVFINSTGNPGMAKGGSGDVLTGILAAFIFQVAGTTSKEKLLNAGIVSVYVHGLAGDLAAKEKTQIAMTPSDIIENIPKALKRTLN